LVVDPVVVLYVFGIVFLGELPDKTAVASLILGARYSALPVLAGVWAAFAVHVAVAVVAGSFVAALPRRPVEVVTAVLFLVGALLLLRSDPEKSAEAGEHEVEQISGERKGLAVAGASFMVVLVAEFGDLTQILTATLAARYREPVSVGIGALLALWAVAAVAVIFGRTLLRVIPLRRVQQLAAAVLVVLSVLTAISAIRG
jgi:putative Ca2+/H+ antiporter (TMEM165/GDT1 family)